MKSAQDSVAASAATSDVTKHELLLFENAGACMTDTGKGEDATPQGKAQDDTQWGREGERSGKASKKTDNCNSCLAIEGKSVAQHLDSPVIPLVGRSGSLACAWERERSLLRGRLGHTSKGAEGRGRSGGGERQSRNSGTREPHGSRPEREREGGREGGRDAEREGEVSVCVRERERTAA